MAKITFPFEFLVLLMLYGSFVSALQDYNSRYEGWKILYRNFSTQASQYLQIAENRGNTFQDYSRTERDAVAVVNLYTQDDPQIFRRVNSQYRNGTVETIWKDFAALLNEAIDILLKFSNSGCRELYRGTTRLQDGIPGHTILKGFTSTTTASNVAFSFGVRDGCEDEGCQVLMVLNGAVGLAVTEYSHFAGEDEVLLKLNSNFDFPSSSLYNRSIPSDLPKLNKELQRLNISQLRVNILANGVSSSNGQSRPIRVCATDNAFIVVPSHITMIIFLIISAYTGFPH